MEEVLGVENDSPFIGTLSKLDFNPAASVSFSFDAFRLPELGQNSQTLLLVREFFEDGSDQKFKRRRNFPKLFDINSENSELLYLDLR